MARGRRRTGAAARRGRPSAIARLSTADLRLELERRRGMLQELVAQRDALSAELQELEAAFGASFSSDNVRRPVGRPRGSTGGWRRRGRPPGSGGGAGRGGRRGPRARNSTNLVDALRGVLAGTTMSVSDIADAVQKAGYRTKSGNFRVIVNQALLANPKIFRKIARGQYTVR